MPRAPVGRIAWFDLTVPEAAATRDFYREVIGWSVHEVAMKDQGEAYADYAMLAEDGTAVGGVCHARGVNTGLPPVWLLYLSGGRPGREPPPGRGGGRPGPEDDEPERDGTPTYAVIRDPVGVPLALLPFRALTLLLLLLLASACASAPPLVESDHARVLAQRVLPGDAPSTPGPWGVGHLTYGSGTDRQRPEYAEGVAFRTTAVDASRLARRTDLAWYWRRYWGFDESAYPRNGRVWYPVDPAGESGEAGDAEDAADVRGAGGAPADDGALPLPAEGPFPLVLVAHGNHDPRRSSDRGYAYLGELLASRGFIVVSVDMNFLNGSIRGENDARGWMYLKHLDAWKAFTEDPENPFLGRVDWERIALVGHSRGGEAVAHAAAFNTLRHYPDDASFTFDFGYRIRSLVAIAPVDGQYEPAEQPVPLEDVNYLTFHGSHDGDVTSFMGLRQFHRVHFTGAVPAFKSAVFVYRANHGQWNTGWGARDAGPRSHRILRLGDLLPMEDQLEFARVWVTAFLEATLLDEERWLPLFRDHRTAGSWLPPTMYKTRFEHSTFRSLADFSEDVDLTTGSLPGVTLEGSGLSTWREGELVIRTRLNPQRQRPQGPRAVWLGFHPAGDARYTVHLAPGVAGGVGLGPGATLDFVMGATPARPGPPRRTAEEGEDPEDAEDRMEPGHADPRADADAEAEGGLEGAEEEAPPDLTVILVDAQGRVAALPLSSFGPLRKPLDVQVMRRGDLEAERLPAPHEVMGHHFSLPLDDFVAANPAFDPAALSELRFVFDRTPRGEVWLARLGVSRPDPAFLTPRIAPERP
jgi:hypothetical protein